MSYQPPVYKPTNTLAIVSLIFGIASWCVLPMLGMIVAIVCGHMARGEIRRAAGTMEGDGFAVAVLVLGYAQLLLGLLMALFFIGLLIFGVSIGFHALHWN
jgi:thiol:disulfide interchange protein